MALEDPDTFGTVFVWVLLVLLFLIILIGIILFIVYTANGTIFPQQPQEQPILEKEVVKEMQGTKNAIVKMMFVDGKPVVKQYEELQQDHDYATVEEEQQEDRRETKEMMTQVKQKDSFRIGPVQAHRKEESITLKFQLFRVKDDHQKKIKLILKIKHMKELIFESEPFFHESQDSDFEIEFVSSYQEFDLELFSFDERQQDVNILEFSRSFFCDN